MAAKPPAGGAAGGGGSAPPPPPPMPSELRSAWADAYPSGTSSTSFPFAPSGADGGTTCLSTWRASAYASTFTSFFVRCTRFRPSVTRMPAPFSALSSAAWTAFRWGPPKRLSWIWMPLGPTFARNPPTEAPATWASAFPVAEEPIAATASPRTASIWIKPPSNSTSLAAENPRATAPPGEMCVTDEDVATPSAMSQRDGFAASPVEDGGRETGREGGASGNDGALTCSPLVRDDGRTAFSAAANPVAARRCAPLIGIAAKPPTVPVAWDPLPDAVAASSAPRTRAGAPFLEIDERGGDDRWPLDGYEACAWNG